MSSQQGFKIVLKNLLGEQVPNSMPIELHVILNDSYFEKINSRPVYQRQIRWTPTAMNDFVSTIMNNGLVPGLIMYKLDTTEKCGKYEYEMVDGQHRLFALKAFMDSTEQNLPSISAKPFIVHWVYENVLEDGTSDQCHVFYKRTPDVENWCNKNGKRAYYLTEGNDEAKSQFDGYQIDIKIIRKKLSLDRRREMFMSIQKGIPVRNSDLLKNKTGCKFMEFIREHGYEQMMYDTFFTHCHKKAPKFWVQWASRCFFLYKRYFGLFMKEELNSLNESEIFLYKDTYIKKLIDDNNIEFNPKSETVIPDFDKVFRTYIDFLFKMKDEKLNPTQMFALFYVCCDSSAKLDIILTHIPYISIEGGRPENKQMWECKADREPRRQYFNKCLEEFRKFDTTAEPLDDRKITQSLRKKVWKKCENEKCAICEFNLITEKTFEAGHIESRKSGGATELKNLLPMCFECNRDMRTRNAYEYQKDVYPEVYKKRIAKMLEETDVEKPLKKRKYVKKNNPLKTNIQVPAANPHIFFE
jgi:hypothetical protein